jgi:hypothetical protein
MHHYDSEPNFYIVFGRNSEFEDLKLNKNSLIYRLSKLKDVCKCELDELFSVTSYNNSKSNYYLLVIYYIIY